MQHNRAPATADCHLPCPVRTFNPSWFQRSQIAIASKKITPELNSIPRPLPPFALSPSKGRPERVEACPEVLERVRLWRAWSCPRATMGTIEETACESEGALWPGMAGPSSTWTPMCGRSPPRYTATTLTPTIARSSRASSWRWTPTPRRASAPPLRPAATPSSPPSCPTTPWASGTDSGSPGASSSCSTPAAGGTSAVRSAATSVPSTSP